MSAYTVTPIENGYEIDVDGLTVTARDPRVREGAVRAVVTVRDGPVILARDQMMLTSASRRSRFIDQLAEKGVTLEDGVLVALDEAIRTSGSALPDPGVSPAERLRESERWADALLDDPNIMTRVEEAIRAQGFAGDTTAALLAYLAFTSRLTPRPVNAAFVGPSSSGKSRTVEVAANLFPDSAIYRLDGASQLALVYSEEEFRHRTIFLAEADSLPEEGASASALRAIVTDNRMRYVTVERQGNTLGTREIVKEGPTGLITTSVRPPREQLGTRMLLVSIPDSESHHRAVLAAQAAAAHGARATFDATPFRALQDLLQLQGERQVEIPFAAALGARVPARAPRAMRDFPQLLSLIQASAILHQRHRATDDEGRLIARRDDYELVRALVRDTYAAVSQAGLTPAIRKTVEAVGVLLGERGSDARLRYKEISDALGLAASSGKWRIDRAIALGFLVNEESRRGQPAQIRLGDPLPEPEEALPRWEELFPPLPPEGFESSNRALGEPREAAANPGLADTAGEPARFESPFESPFESAPSPVRSGSPAPASGPIRRFESDLGERAAQGPAYDRPAPGCRVCASPAAPGYAGVPLCERHGTALVRRAAADPGVRLLGEGEARAVPRGSPLTEQDLMSRREDGNVPHHASEDGELEL